MVVRNTNTVVIRLGGHGGGYEGGVGGARGWYETSGGAQTSPGSGDLGWGGSRGAWGKGGEGSPGWNYGGGGGGGLFGGGGGAHWTNMGEAVR